MATRKGNTPVLIKRTIQINIVGKDPKILDDIANEVENRIRPFIQRFRQTEEIDAGAILLGKNEEVETTP